MLFIRRIWRNRWVRRLLPWAVVALLILSFFWSLPQMVNKRAIRARLLEWVVGQTGESTPASIGRVDLALRASGRTDLYVHDFELDTVNPRFDLPWLFVDTFRASAPLYRLFGGMALDPVIQVRDGILRLEWDKQGRSNLEGLELKRGGWQMPMLNRLQPGELHFVLMKCAVLVDRPEIAGQLQLNGSLRVQPQTGLVRLDVASDGNRFELRSADSRGVETKEKLEPGFSLTGAEYDFNTRQLLKGSAEMIDIPLRLGRLLLPGLPVFGGAAAISGRARYAGGSGEFTGEVRGLKVQPLPERVGVTVRCDRPADGAEHWRVQLSETAGEAVAADRAQPFQTARPVKPASGSGLVLAAAEADRGADGKWGALLISCLRLDFDTMIAQQTHPWLQFVLGNFRAVRAEIGSARLAGFELGRMSLELFPAKDGRADISLGGDIAGGKLALVARGTPLAGGGRPDLLLGTLSIPDAGDMILRFSGLLPPVVQCSPTEGRGELAVRYEQKAGGAGAVLRLRLDLKNVEISAQGGGELMQELTGLPRRIIELENLCRRAQIKALDPLPLTQEPLAKLTFESLQVSYEITPGGKSRLLGLVGVSPELGRLEGVGGEEADGNYRFAFVLRNTPAGLAGNPQLSATLRAALAAVLSEKGLRLECLSGPRVNKVDALYMQEVFRVWSENFSHLKPEAAAAADKKPLPVKPTASVVPVAPVKKKEGAVE